jgi:hypothetical protein
MKKKTYKEALLQFEQQGRKDILLLEEGYECWRKKAKFLDLIISEVFEAIPKSVFYQESCHPKRAKELRKQTNLEKYGNVCSLHGTTIEAKEVNKKKVETWKKKYGVEHFSKSKPVREKVKKTNLERYGVENQGQLKKIMVENSTLSVEDWFNFQSEPKPCSYQSFGAIFLFGKGRVMFSKEELEKFLLSYKEHKTSLEKKTEELLGITHFNQKVSTNLKYRPDFQLSNKNYLNVDGLFWHSIKNKDKKYHFEMREEYEKHGIRIFQFREDEITSSGEIIQSMIQHQEVGSTKTYARKTVVKEVLSSDATVFLNQNHLMGSTNAKHIGLFEDKNLLCLLSYKRKSKCLIIERFANKKFHTVIGGLSKLLAWCKSNLEINKIESWVDLRYGTGESLRKLGFTNTKTVLSWKWTDGKTTYNRLRCRANMDERKLPEKQYANELGWYKIYDAGQRLFELQL